jgi:hypothetical protein
MNKIKKIVLVLLLFAFLNTAFAPSAHAFWDSPMMAVIYQMTVEKLQKTIYDTIVANLKIAAMKIIQARLMSLLQSTGVPMDGVAGAIISDWKMFIFSSATKYSDQITSDFFRGLSSGAATGMQQRVIGPAQMAAMMNPTSLRPNLQNYIPNGDASQIFQLGKSMNPWVIWNVAAQPQNDLAYWTSVGMGVRQSAYEQEVIARQSQGQSGQGYVGKETANKSNGPIREATTSSGAKVSVPPGSDYKGQNITTTGSDIKALANDVVIHVQTQMLATAQTIPQVVSGMVSQMISQVIQQGADKIANPGSSGGMDLSSMGSAMTSQMQGLVQSGVRNIASPNTFFGSSGSSSSSSGSSSGSSGGSTPSSLPASSLPSGFNRGGQD